MFRFTLAIAFSAAISLSASAAELNPPPLAITNVAVVDVESGKTIPDCTVILRDGKIAASGPKDSVRIPPAVKVVDGTGKFLIPGLWDTHVHLWDAENVLPLYIAYGITGVQDMGSDFARTSGWRRAIEEGKALGPRIITSGPAVDGRASPEARLPILVAATAIQARAAFDKLYDLDVDFMKVLSGLGRDAYFALAEQARHWNLPLRGHVPTAISVWEAVEARQRSVEHFFGVPYACSSEFASLEPQRQKAIAAKDYAAVRRFLERGEKTFSEQKCAALFRKSADLGTAYTPTLTLWKRMLNLDLDTLTGDPRLNAVPASIRKIWPDPRQEKEVLNRTPKEEEEQRQYLQKISSLILLLRESGAMILAGTDTGDAYTAPGATLHDELISLVRAGLGPAEALRASTLTPARFFRQEALMGSIAPGKFADLVLLDADPLEDIRAVRRISAVFARGRLFAREELDEMLKPAKAATQATVH